MMQLSRLELVGFKSFADKTEFVFERGITALVGPNGCGKSNIVDAIKWILGEQSVRSLRGSEMADVIFSGNDNRRPLGFAEASITLTDVRDALAVDCDEVTITRRVYRNGEGEYLINHQQCRLRDIRELFMDTGIGADTYSLIEQGRVGYLLQANSQERRLIFEEAAGISKFKARKKAALARIEKTGLHLLRLQDVIEEVNRRLHSVRIQAGKARRCVEYRGELQRLCVGLLQNDYLEAKERKSRADAELDRISARRHELSSRMEELATRREEQAVNILQFERSLEETRAERHRLDTDLRLQEQSVAEARRRIEEAEAQRCKLEEGLTGLLARIEREEEDIEKLRKEAEAARAEVQRCACDLQGNDGRRASTASDLETVYERLRDTETTVQELFHEESVLRNEIASLEANADNLEKTVGRLSARLETAAGKRKDAAGASSCAREEVSRLTTEIEARQERCEVLGKDQEEKDAEIERLRENLASLKQQRVAREARRDMLDDLHRRREGVSAGARAVLEERDRGNKDFSGVLGLLGDFIRASGESARVIEAAVGHAAEALVVDTFEEARRAIEFVASRRIGRITCLIRDGFPRSRTTSHRWDGYRPVVDLLPEEVRSDPVVRSLLERACFVKDLNAARAGGDRLPEAVFVTSRGDVLENGGVLTGGDGSAGPGIISRRAELDGLGEEIARIAGEEEKIAADAASLARECDALDSRRRAEAEAADVLRARHAQTVARAGGLAAELARLDNELRADESELAELHEVAGEISGHLNEKKAELFRCLQRRQSLDETRRRDIETRDELRRRLSAIDETISESRVRLAQYKEKVSHLERRRSHQETELSERRSFLESARREIDNSRARIGELRSEVGSGGERARALRASRAEVERRLGELEIERGNARNDVGEIEQELRAKRGLLSAIDEEHEKTRLDQQRCDIELASLVERLREEYDLDLEEISKTFERPEEMNWEETRARIEELRRKIDNMGAVNMEALDELTELEERNASLDAQRADIEKAKADLEEVIRRIEKVSEESFRATFMRVRDNFQEFFRKLFGGGKADVVLEDEDNVLDCGIEIIAKPPGKEPRAVSLLSGGEKALTTIALLFAVLRSRPSPFVVLDEVDAPLDETNIERFVNLVKEFLARSQFVIITHSKRTMSMANALYGITMEEKGVSCKVEVRIEKYVPPAQEAAPEAFEETEPKEARVERDILVDAGALDNDEDTVGDPTPADEETLKLI